MEQDKKLENSESDSAVCVETGVIRNYSNRQWLNPGGSASTGSVVAYYGEAPWDNGSKLATFLEIADCHNKVRLHKSDKETLNDFIVKMRVLRDAIDLFIAHLDGV